MHSDAAPLLDLCPTRGPNACHSTSAPRSVSPQTHLALREGDLHSSVQQRRVDGDVQVALDRQPPVEVARPRPQLELQRAVHEFREEGLGRRLGEHVGDTIQIGDVAGQVRRIGIRSTTVQTAVGAEVIVPNASLVAEKVTNWTLSSRVRRIDVPVGVAYGTPPEKVLELLRGVAAAHPDVLAKPAPEALFLEFADSALKFELRSEERRVGKECRCGWRAYHVKKKAGR